MKKLFYLFLFVLPLIGATSCDDNDDLPNVSMNATFEGVTNVDGVLYVVSGDVIKVKSVNLIDNTEKGAKIGSVVYSWDYYRIGSSVVPPFGIDIETKDATASDHLLLIKTSIFAVDYAPCYGYLEYPIKIVASEDEIPEDGDTESAPTSEFVISEEEIE